MLFLESESAASYGKFAQSRELTRNAADSALRAKETEMPAEYQAHAAVREALAGNAAFAKQQAQAALKLSKGKRVSILCSTLLSRWLAIPPARRSWRTMSRSASRRHGRATRIFAHDSRRACASGW